MFRRFHSGEHTMLTTTALATRCYDCGWRGVQAAPGFPGSFARGWRCLVRCALGLMLAWAIVLDASRALAAVVNVHFGPGTQPLFVGTGPDTGDAGTVWNHVTA